MAKHCLHITLSLLLALPLTALAQEGTPANAPLAEGTTGERAWNPTVGFELKTTTHNADRSGRTTAHGLMEYVVPKADASWTPEQRQIVERWDRMNISERTKFFFEAYKGGHQANNFTTDTRKAPFLDGSVSWYEHMNIPHIEVRSKPFNSKEEALERMKELRSNVKETIAFHTHYRFPYLSDKVQPNAEAVTDWMRRVSWSVWLNRARISNRSDFVLKAMDNTPVNVAELEKALKTFEAPGSHAQKDIIERRGIRVNRLSSAQGPMLDIEFRGLMKDVNRIEKFVEAADKAFRTGEFGPTAYNSESAFRGHEAKNVLDFYTFGWHGKGTIKPRELEYISEKVESLREANGIRTELTPEQLKTAVRRMATADSDAGKKMLMPVSWEFLFMPLEADKALPQEVREQYKQQRKAYIEKLVILAERVNSGEFGQNSEYKPEKVASRTRRILLDFVKEGYTAGTKKGTLGEFYEMSVFEPSKIAELDRQFRERTGQREGFAGTRAGNNQASEAGRQASRQAFEVIRAQAIEAAGMRATEGGDPATRSTALKGVGELAELKFEISPERKMNIEYDRANKRVVMSEGLIGEIEARARTLPEAERAKFVRNVTSLMIGHEVSHAAGLKAERVADAEAVRLAQRAAAMRGEPLTGEEIRNSVRTFTEAGTKFQNVLYRLKNVAQYGTVSGREANMLRTAAGQADALANYRRADGTLRWNKLTADKTLQQGAGVAHFALALFLKELAVVVKTGDRLRIEEFFDGLATTDFYMVYGLFSLGAQVGNVAYSRTLAKFVKPQFVSGILRTNVVLATGMALSEIAMGHFEGKAFAISVTALGLSTTAVKAGVAGIKWVVDLKRADSARKLVQTGTKLRRIARLGGWFYTAAETAVVLYFGDEIAAAMNHYFDRKAAKEAVSEATMNLFDKLGEDLSDEEFEKALDQFQTTHLDYRNHLLKSVGEEQAVLAARMEKIARELQRLETERAQRKAQLEANEKLKEVVLKQYDSVDAYLDQSFAKDVNAATAKIEEVVATYERNFEKRLQDIYNANRRDSAYLDHKHALWAAQGGDPNADNSPVSSNMILSRFTADRVRSSIAKQAGDVSDSRMQAYEDERAALELIARSLSNNPERAALVRERIRSSEQMTAMDRRLVEKKAAEGSTSILDRALKGE